MFAILACGLAVATACAPQPPPARPVATAPPVRVDPASLPPPARSPLGPDGKLRAGLLLPLSGPQAGVGEALLHAATLALFQHNAGHVELLPKDTGGDPARAAAAAREALAEGARAILGPLFASETAAVAAIAVPSGVPVLAFTTDASQARPGVWVVGQLPEPAIRRVVAAARAAGAERFALLAPDTPFGRLVAEAYARAVADTGGMLVRRELYSGDNPAPAVRRLADYDTRRGPIEAQARASRAEGTAEGRRRAALIQREARIPPPPFDALLLADSGDRLRAVAALLPFYDIDSPPVRILATPLLAAMPDAGSEPALVGAWFAAPDDTRREAFAARYREAFGADPPLVAGVAFDAAAIVASLAATNPPDLSPGALTQPSGFAGVLGLVRLMPDGTNRRALALIEVTRDGFRVLEPAPERFEDVVF